MQYCTAEFNRSMPFPLFSLTVVMFLSSCCTQYTCICATLAALYMMSCSYCVFWIILEKLIAINFFLIETKNELLDHFGYRPFGRAKYIHSYRIYSNRRKKFRNIFRPPFWRYSISSRLWYCCAVSCKNEHWKSGKRFYRFPTEEKKKKAWIAATKRKNRSPTWVSCMQCALFFHLCGHIY